MSCLLEQKEILGVLTCSGGGCAYRIVRWIMAQRAHPSPSQARRRSVRHAALAEPGDFFTIDTTRYGACLTIFSILVTRRVHSRTSHIRLCDHVLPFAFHFILGNHFGKPRCLHRNRRASCVLSVKSVAPRTAREWTAWKKNLKATCR